MRTPRLATSADMARAAELATTSGRIGVDTEFMSEGRYRALLCLVQIAVDDPANGHTPHILLIDALDQVDVTPVAQLLADRSIEVVLHAGRQDVAILRREWKTTFTNVFDTQVAAGFAGFSAQAGYNGLLHDVLRIRLPKKASTLTRAGGTETMLLDGWNLNGVDTRNVVAHEAFQFAVGGTLHVAANQAEGTYIGSFDVTIDYN